MIHMNCQFPGSEMKPKFTVKIHLQDSHSVTAAFYGWQRAEIQLQLPHTGKGPLDILAVLTVRLAGCCSRSPWLIGDWSMEPSHVTRNSHGSLPSYMPPLTLANSSSRHTHDGHAWSWLTITMTVTRQFDN